MSTRSKYFAAFFSGALAALAVFIVSNYEPKPQTAVPTPVAHAEVIDSPVGQVGGLITPAKPKLLMPVAGGLTRVTKKPFGLYVSPASSPVDNDIFLGFHTGIDFETTAAEQNTDVIITAACDGPVILKQWAKGYGGVLVQACQLDGFDVTVIYGHMKLDSIPLLVGQTLTAGDEVGVLGEGFSHETDGRRKHLHFDIHQGSELNILGYVPTEDDLANWIDPRPYLE